MLFKSTCSLATTLLITATNAASLAPRAGPPTANVKNGTYTGITANNVDMFLGMPFAQPPLDDLRFNLPMSLNTTWKNSRNATQYGYECYGYGSDQWVLGNIVSEDCLTLNVVRPSGYGPDAKLPVGVWIHGGGFTEGGGRDPRYNLTKIVANSVTQKQPIIGVSINYRLQAFGYIWGTEVKKAGVTNLGFRDQRLALHWINENVNAFGGDPSKVTIWGESAGGNSIGTHLIAYGGRDDKIFRGGIMESGAPIAFAPAMNASSWDKYYNNITKATNCRSATNTLACLRKVPIGQLNAVLNSSVTAHVPGWGGHIDGDFIQMSPAEQLNQGKFVHVPILQGTNFDEGTSFGAKGINTTAQFLAVVESGGPNATVAQTFALLYPDIPGVGVPGTLDGRPTGVWAALGHQYKRASAYGGDLAMQAARRMTSQAYAAENVTNWSYHFNIVPNGVPPEIGACHFQEVSFVFDNTNGMGYNNSVAVDPFENKPKTYVAAASLISSLWTSFIATGDPNSGNGTYTVSPVLPDFPTSPS
jgi:carboxylesterase type B